MTDDLARSLADSSHFDAFYGLQVDACGEDGVRGHLDIEPYHHQPTGVVHGGVYAAIAENLASIGTNWHVTPRGQVGMGMSNCTSFLRPVASGTVHAEARTRHRGSTTWVWDVDLRDDEGRTCAISRVTIAVRTPGPAPGSPSR